MKAEGVMVRDIAKHFGVSREIISRHTKHIKSPVDYQRIAAVQRALAFHEKQRVETARLREIARELRACHWKLTAIAQEIGRSVACTAIYCKGVLPRAAAGHIGPVVPHHRAGRRRSAVPAWVPEWLRLEYREVARKRGDIEAARHCRHLKREASLAVAEAPQLRASL